MDMSELNKKLAQFPRVKLLWGKTPIVKCENLSKKTGVNLFFKRDDLSGLALGGNKTRKLEYIIGEALANKYDTVITAGAVHSNHALQTAAAARKYGLDAVLVLRGKSEDKGNLLMDKLLDADIRIYDVPSSSMLKPYMEKIAKDLTDKGKRPMIIPVGGSMPTGVLGYIGAAAEIIEQCDERDLKFDYVVSATSSGGTQTGLMLGFKLLDPRVKVLGIGVGDPKQELINDMYNLAINTAKVLKLNDNIISKEEIEANTIDGYGFGGYGTIVKEIIGVIKYAAKEEGVYFDPVYTGKAFYGLMDIIDKRIIPQGSKVLFINTGGLGGLFQYEEIVSKDI